MFIEWFPTKLVLFQKRVFPKKILFKKQLFDLEVKGQGPTKVIMVCNTLPYGHAPTYQISLGKLKPSMV
jgi:hypothetical protein